ncbi:MAG: hypothetical protein IJ746_02190 [Ruminococcus sp.]|nr:hypothetical protein [Ruminococcus sp.]
MKKLIALVVCLGLAGCGSDGSSLDNSPSETAGAAPTTTSRQTEKEGKSAASRDEEKAPTEPPAETAPTPEEEPPTDESSEAEQGLLSSPEELCFRDTDGAGTTYAFVYGGEDFEAQYTEDNWRIIDSYRVTNAADMKIICQQLLDTHPIHGSDYESFRTADDMVYEWRKHNLGYAILPESSRWKQHAKDVDFDPDDQGRSAFEIFLDRLWGE